MLPNDKKLKSLMNKIKKNAEKKYEAKQSVTKNIDEVLDNKESTDMFQEMKKLPFTE